MIGVLGPADIAKKAIQSRAKQARMHSRSVPASRSVPKTPAVSPFPIMARRLPADGQTNATCRRRPAPLPNQVSEASILHSTEVRQRDHRCRTYIHALPLSCPRARAHTQHGATVLHQCHIFLLNVLPPWSMLCQGRGQRAERGRTVLSYRSCWAPCRHVVTAALLLTCPLVECWLAPVALCRRF